MKRLLSYTVCFVLIVSLFSVMLPTKAEAFVKLDTTNLTIGIAETRSIYLGGTKGDIIWSSSNTSIVTVTNSGDYSGTSVHGLKKGSATVTATYKNKKYNCKVTVTQRHFISSKIYLTQGELYHIKSPKNFINDSKIISVYSYDKKIANGYKTGNIKAFKAGATTIVFSTGYSYASTNYEIDVIVVPKSTVLPKLQVTHYSITSEDNFSEISSDGKKFSTTIRNLNPEKEHKVYYRNVKTTTKNPTTVKSTIVKTKSKLNKKAIEKGTYPSDISNLSQSTYGTQDNVYYYERNSNFYSVVIKDANLYINTYDSGLNFKSSKKITLPYPIFGGFYDAPDGNFYVAVGQTIKEKTDGKKVCYCILKFDSNWKLLDKATINGDTARTITPYSAGTCSMALIGSDLIFYAARLRYKSDDGLNHQSNYTAVIDTKSMDVTYNSNDFPFNHVSHSFQTFVKTDGESALFVDHGDAYPRSISIQQVDNFKNSISGDTFYTNVKALDLLKITGRTGDNFTGSNVTGFEIGRHNNLVVGNSLPHDNPISGVKWSDSTLTRNIYLSVVDKTGASAKLIWLTSNNPKGTLNVTTPRLVKINEDKFAVMFTTYTSINYNTVKKDLVVITINSKGDILNKKYYEPYFNSTSQPIYTKGKIRWYDNSPLNQSYIPDNKFYSINVD